MTSDCGTCSRPIADGAVICVTCAYQLDDAIQDVSAYRGLAYDLDIAVTRQARIGQRSGGKSTETPLAYDQRASDANEHLRGVLVGWARIIADETGAELPADDLARIAAWLRPRVGWLRHHEAGAEAWDEILQAVRDARRAVDRPADKAYAGPCGACGTAMYARPNGAYVTCPSADCGETYQVEECREWMRGQLEDEIGGAARVAMICTGLGVKVSPSAIRKWADPDRDRLRPCSYAPPRTDDGIPSPQYRVGDVIRVAAGENLYATETAC